MTTRGVTGRDIARPGLSQSPAPAERSPLPTGRTTQPTTVARPVIPELPDPNAPVESPKSHETPREGEALRAPTAVPSAPKNVLRGIEPLLPPMIEVVPPESPLQGQLANFTIRVRNPNPAMLRDVRVTARFGEQWEFDESDLRVVELRIGDIAAQSTRECELSLMPLTSGRGAIDLAVTVEQQPAFTTTAAAVVRPRVIDLGLAGPEQRGVGQRAEYLISVVNASGRDLPDTRVDVAYDPAALAIREVSAGGRHATGSSAWLLGTLMRDERVQIPIEFECTAEARRSAIDCEVSAEGRTITTCGARLEIVPAPAVDIAIVDPDDPVSVGEPVRFQIRVRNRSGKSVDDLELRLTTSPHFEQLHPTAEPTAPPADVQTDAYGIEFHSQGLAPGAELTFTAAATAALVGDGVLRVSARTAAVSAPFEVTESAVVNPPAAVVSGEVTPARQPTGPSP